MNLCKVCGQMLESIISFGKMPISNRFISDPSADEYLYDLSVGFCPACFMVQLEQCVEPEMMFNEAYAFHSSTSEAMAEHFKKVANEIINTVSPRSSPFVVEIGCNDGIMLKHVANRNINHLGIEPSANVAAIAREKGVNVTETFFNAASAEKILKKEGPADVICGANVMCHIEDINSVFKGIDILLKPDGVLFFEDPYLYDIITKNSFDQIYDEHVYYYSGLSVSELTRRHDLQLVNMSPQDVHGGSMRYYIRKGRDNTVSPNVERYIHQEKNLGLHTAGGYLPFKDKINQICSDFKKTLIDIKSRGQTIAAYGATSKSTTLLTYAKVGADLIDYVSDTTPTKIGKYTPGTHIPVKSHEHFLADTPPFTVLFAWNHKREIFKKEKNYRENGGKFITFFPDVIIE
ncbi:methyltransferase domain-containing protein [Thermodesulfobacteriota bacterium]